MSSRNERRPSSGSSSGPGSSGRRPFRDGPPPLRRNREDSWGNRPEARSSDSRRHDRQSSDKRFTDRGGSDRRRNDRRSSFERRAFDREPKDWQSNDWKPTDRRFSERRSRDSVPSDRRSSFERRSSEGSRSSRDRFPNPRLSEQRSSGRRFSGRPEHGPGPGDRRDSWDRTDRVRRPRSDERRSSNSDSNRRFSQRLDDKSRGEASPHAAEPVADDLLWGRHATQAALEAGRPIHRVWCTSELRSTSKFLQLLKDAKSSGVLVEEVSWARLGQLTGGAVHQGIVLQTAAAETFDLGDLVKGCSALDEAPLLLALDGLTDPHNLGAIVRSAEALGAHGVVLPQRRSAGLTGSVAKVAAGALEHLPVARVVNLNRSLETLKTSGYRVIGLAEEGDLTLEEVDLEGPLVIVTGSEGQGLSMLTRRHCDQLIRIPLRGVTPSLNASVATALCLYEVARRSWMKGLKGQNPSPRITRPHLVGSTAAMIAASSKPEDQPTEQHEEIKVDNGVRNPLEAPLGDRDCIQPSEPPMVNIELQRDPSELSGTDAFEVSIEL